MSLWEQFERDPREPSYAGLRASDRDRDVVREVLATAFADGRLTREEFDQRVEQVAAAKTLGELPALVQDLVPTAGHLTGPRSSASLRAEAEERYQRARHQALMSALLPSIICWSVYLFFAFGADGTHFPWPIFVTLGTGWRWFELTTSKETSIRNFERQIRRKHDRELRRHHSGELGTGDQDV